MGRPPKGCFRIAKWPSVHWTTAAQSASGVGIGGDLKLGGRGGPMTPGRSAGLGGIGSTSKGTSGSGTTAKVAGPKGSASVSSSMAAGTVSGAAGVVARMRAGFRRCYQRGLDQNPDISGSIRLTIMVGPGGNGFRCQWRFLRVIFLPRLLRVLRREHELPSLVHPMAVVPRSTCLLAS